MGVVDGVVPSSVVGASVVGVPTGVWAVSSSITIWDGIDGKMVADPLSSRSVALATMTVVSARPSADAVPPAQYQVLVRASSGALTGRKPCASRGVVASSLED